MKKKLLVMSNCVRGLIVDAGLKDIFMALDTCGDGVLTIDEIREGIRRSGIRKLPHDLEALLSNVDTSGTGCIDFTGAMLAIPWCRFLLRIHCCVLAPISIQTRRNLQESFFRSGHQP
eukprot:Gregarina_sp_Poly_1__7516@NODE_4198_length_690_cov_143_993579_g2767_i0_p1_GENE_NODE_4198_length_690_cov_143_993579_g2767_i0NODE_4198_length_690_cov_143_993579_g2767_i0_p1_ORF_typecomplete_len118_score3_50EFhand_7/PF13499_6/1_4e09EFhand_8/PF13833_6/0_026EFhand_8/PF13833_6/0_32EFhand_1/PF00036_32/0_013EFhand_1/PF00036_32/15EFhand_6/PF13405_6/0_0078EFhand_6/PF13405_6/2_7e02EFhand_11/PF08976_11/0_12EFhand_4/PF12763_7/0_15_NODE_4198_length_690_cov_143_993579_g2767_i0289642